MANVIFKDTNTVNDRTFIVNRGKVSNTYIHIDYNKKIIAKYIIQILQEVMAYVNLLIFLMVNIL